MKYSPNWFFIPSFLHPFLTNLLLQTHSLQSDRDRSETQMGTCFLPHMKWINDPPSALGYLLSLKFAHKVLCGLTLVYLLHPFSLLSSSTHTYVVLYWEATWCSHTPHSIQKPPNTFCPLNELLWIFTCCPVFPNHSTSSILVVGGVLIDLCIQQLHNC